MALGAGRSARAGTALRITGYRPDGRRRRPGPHRLAGAVAGCDESDPPLGAGARADRCSRRCSHDRDRCSISALTTILVAISHTRNHPGTDTSVTLAASSPRAGLGRAQRTRLRLLVAAQIAVAVLLLVGGGLVLRSFAALRGTDIGFRPRIASAQLTLPPSCSRIIGAGRPTWSGWPPRCARFPASPTQATTNIPCSVRLSIRFTRSRETGRQSERCADHRSSGRDAGLPAAPCVRLTRGRLLAESDTADAPVVITEELARQAWPGEDPIGRRVRRGRAADTIRGSQSWA